ncbi:MAG TPA: acyltransferase [Polyangia bacterium]
MLALFVVQGHLLAGAPSWLSFQAVFSFYVLSGFLMTLVLDKSYGFGLANFASFCANRALRLFPAYYVVALTTLLVILFVGPLNSLNDAIVTPTTTPGAAANLFIFGLAGITIADMPAARLVPPAWSLCIELFCYVLLGLYFARTPRRLLVMLGVGVLITAAQIAPLFFADFRNWDFQNHYGVLQAGLIPFAAGGLAYFHRESKLFRPSSAKIAALAGLFALNIAAGYASTFHVYVSGLYLCVIVNFFLVPALFRSDEMRPKRRWQEMLGGMAYPVFLSHWLIGTLVAISFSALPLWQPAFFFVSLFGTVLFAAAIYLVIDLNAERLRARIKKRAVAQSSRADGLAGHPDPDPRFEITDAGGHVQRAAAGS